MTSTSKSSANAHHPSELRVMVDGVDMTPRPLLPKKANEQHSGSRGQSSSDYLSSLAKKQQQKGYEEDDFLMDDEKPPFR